jgi:hypothetical protein
MIHVKPNRNALRFRSAGLYDAYLWINCSLK